MNQSAINYGHGCGPIPMSGVEMEFRRKLGAQYREVVGYDPFEDDPSISTLEVAKTLREVRKEMGIALPSPEFDHSPMLNRWQMIAYGGERNGYDLEPMEYFYGSPKSDAAIIERAKFEARWQGRTHVKVRLYSGQIIYDGEA